MSSKGNRLYPRVGIHGRVVHELGRDIVTGQYRPGEKLPVESVFMNRFSGSRTAIREAFRVLAAKGLLEARQRAGTHVRARRFWNLLDPDVMEWQLLEDSNIKSVQQMMELRNVLEPAVARLAAERASEDQIIILEEIQKDIETSEAKGERAKFFRAVRDFHLCLYDICRNEYAERLKDVIVVTLRYLYDRRDSGRHIKVGVARWHGLILEKIRAGDGRGAEELSRTLIARETELIRLPAGHNTSIRNTVARAPAARPQLLSL